MEWKVYLDGDAVDIDDFLKFFKENNINYHPSSNMLSYTWGETLEGRKAIALARERGRAIKIPKMIYKVQFAIGIMIPVSLFILDKIYDWWKEKRKKPRIRMAIKTKHVYLDLKTTSPEDIEIIYNEEKDILA